MSCVCVICVQGRIQNFLDRGGGKNFFLKCNFKSFDYQLLDTLDERGKGIPKDRDKRVGRKGYKCD